METGTTNKEFRFKPDWHSDVVVPEGTQVTWEQVGPHDEAVYAVTFEGIGGPYMWDEILLSLLLDNVDPDGTYDVAQDDGYDDSMDGDAESALASAGWGTDEDYGDFGNGCDDF